MCPLRGLGAWALSIAFAGTSALACGDDGAGPEDAPIDAGPTKPRRAGDDDAPKEPDAAMTDGRDAGAGGCDLSGAWVTQHVTTNSALGSEQIATNWNYHRIAQHGTTV